MSQAAAAASAMDGGAGNNFMTGGALGAAGQAANAAVQRALRSRQQRATAAAMPKIKAFGGAGIKQRFENVESRLEKLEGGNQKPIQSVQPTQAFVQGSSVGPAPTIPSAPIATGSLDATASPGSLQEVMPSPGDPASEMFGTEFMRNASVGAAKMRMNKKL